MKNNPREFGDQIDALLQMYGLKFQGIRLRCRQCAEPALAASVPLAQVLGWIDLKQIEGSDYEGLCLTCGGSKQSSLGSVPPTEKLG